MAPTVRRVLTLGAAGLALLWLCCLPRQLFRGTSYSTVVESAEGELLGARIADDGQWRFPPSDSLPPRYTAALIQFEDRHFWWHPGVDPLALMRALWANLRSGHVVSGGSTLSMQVIRLSRGNRERTVWEKVVEAFQATRLEARYSKKKVLALYASHAPFGGNVVGLDAAAWRYFGRPSGELSWGESATLAVLPNAPSSLHLGRGREALLEKRNRSNASWSTETWMPTPMQPPWKSLFRTSRSPFPATHRTILCTVRTASAPVPPSNSPFKRA